MHFCRCMQEGSYSPTDSGRGLSNLILCLPLQPNSHYLGVCRAIPGLSAARSVRPGRLFFFFFRSVVLCVYRPSITLLLSSKREMSAASVLNPASSRKLHSWKKEIKMYLISVGRVLCSKFVWLARGSFLAVDVDFASLLYLHKVMVISHLMTGSHRAHSTQTRA